MKFDINEVLQARVQKLMKRVEGEDRGFVLNHADISRITGEPYMGPQWGAIITKFRNRMLRERKIALKCEHGCGYKLALPDEQLNELMEARQARANRQYNNGIAIGENIDYQNLSDHLRYVRSVRIAKMKEQRRNARRLAREQHVILSKPETLPRVRPTCEPVSVEPPVMGVPAQQAAAALV